MASCVAIPRLNIHKLYLKNKSHINIVQASRQELLQSCMMSKPVFNRAFSGSRTFEELEVLMGMLIEVQKSSEMYTF